MLLLQYSSAFSAQGCPLRQGRYPFQIQYSSGHTIESLVESAEPGLSLIPPQPPSPSVELCWKVACQEALPTSLGTLPRRRTSVPDISEQVCVAGGGGGVHTRLAAGDRWKAEKQAVAAVKSSPWRAQPWRTKGFVLGNPFRFFPRFSSANPPTRSSEQSLLGKAGSGTKQEAALQPRHKRTPRFPPRMQNCFLCSGMAEQKGGGEPCLLLLLIIIMNFHFVLSHETARL